MLVSAKIYKNLSMIIGAVSLSVGSAMADGIVVTDVYAIASSPMAKAGATFVSLKNEGETDDRLLSATSDVAKRVEVHTHLMEDGVMMMREAEEGFPIPAGGELLMKRGGKHVMLMGLNTSLTQSVEFSLTLEFEHAEPMTIMVPVDLERN